jgi:hypothetical protein
VERFLRGFLNWLWMPASEKGDRKGRHGLLRPASGTIAPRRTKRDYRSEGHGAPSSGAHRVLFSGGSRAQLRPGELVKERVTVD